jgi:hypothetical protein
MSSETDRLSFITSESAARPMPRWAATSLTLMPRRGVPSPVGSHPDETAPSSSRPRHLPWWSTHPEAQANGSTGRLHGIPALVARIQRKASSKASGWLDAGNTGPRRCKQVPARQRGWLCQRHQTNSVLSILLPWAHNCSAGPLQPGPTT